MSQPIDVGSVLSGRYLVTESVLTTAEGDMVLGGIDRVLNRSVSIVVAAPANSSQLATSSREIAMGERQANVQVLDLGITDSNETYLVTTVARSSDLLDLVLETQDAPYVEPFFTDTLGTEIFGESRQSVPETYEDDAEYYEQLRYEEEPEEQGKIGNALSSGFAGLKNRFGRKNVDQSSEVPFEDEPEAEYGQQTAPNAQVNTEATPLTEEPVTPVAPVAKPKVTRLDNTEPNVTATAALAAAAQSKGNAPKPSAKTEAKPVAKPAPAAVNKPKAAVVGAAAAAGAGVAAAAASAKSSTFPAAAKNVPAKDVPEPADQEEDENTPKGIRLLVGAVLIAVLVVGVIFAFNFLGKNGQDPVANPTVAPTTQESSEQPSGDSQTPEESDLPAPKIVGISRLVPGNQVLNADTDNTLDEMTDGNPSSTYKTYSFTTPGFGGFASNMVFVLELDKESAIKEINLEGLNATGGNYEILVGTSDDLGDAKSVAKGSFSGPSISVPVKDDEANFMAGTHVFLNVTELPRRASGVNESRPYGLQIGEFSAK